MQADVESPSNLPLHHHWETSFFFKKVTVTLHKVPMSIFFGVAKLRMLFQNMNLVTRHCDAVLKPAKSHCQSRTDRSNASSHMHTRVDKFRRQILCQAVLHDHKLFGDKIDSPVIFLRAEPLPSAPLFNNAPVSCSKA